MDIGKMRGLEELKAGWLCFPYRSLRYPVRIVNSSRFYDCNGRSLGPCISSLCCCGEPRICSTVRLGPGPAQCL